MTKRAQPWPVGSLIVAGAFALALLVGGFGGWSVYARLSGAVIADGSVMVALNRQIVQHPEGGVVARVAVREGDVVARGDVLIALDPYRLHRQITALEGQIDTLNARRARLLAERDGLTEISPKGPKTANASPFSEQIKGQRRLFRARHATRAQELDQQDLRRLQINGQIAGIRAQHRAYLSQYALIQTELDQQENLLARGLAQSARVTALRREIARLQGVLGELEAQISVSHERATEVTIQKLKLQNQWREEAIGDLRDLEARLWDLSQQRTALIEQREDLYIRAPVSGVVYGLEVFAERAVIRPAQPLLYLVPQDRPMTILARVGLLDVDHVRPGQPVELRFPGVVDADTVGLAGRVTRLSPDAIAQPDGTGAFYHAQIELETPAALAPGSPLALRPGMPVQAFFKTADRRPISYLIEPLAAYFRKAFRES